MRMRTAALGLAVAMLAAGCASDDWERDEEGRAGDNRPGTPLSIGETPQAVISAFHAAFGDAPIHRVEKVTGVRGETQYAITFTGDDGKRRTARFSQTGSPL